MNDSPKQIRVTNPATGEPIEEYSLLPPSEIDKAITKAKEVFVGWSRSDFGFRASILERAAGLLESRKEDLARTMTREMGKPVTSARAEVDKCAWVCRYYAENAADFLAEESVETDPDEQAWITFQPLGIVFAVMPWNFPLWQVFRFAAPGLMAGNVALLKHAENVPGCARAIESILLDAGVPEGGFRHLPVDHDGAAKIIAHEDICAVTLTGSTGAGRAVASTAGEHLKKSVLELGGSDPYLVLADANVARAAEICAKSRLLNSGQSCIAAKRFIVAAEVREEFEHALVQEMASVKVGDPMNDATQVGPMARFDLRDELHDQVSRSKAAGAVPLLGGEVPADGELKEGAYYPPTVLSWVRPGVPAFDEELFGPVAAVSVADDTAHAIRLANTSCFGLGAAIFSEDLELARRIANTELEAGSVAINGLVASDPRLPFGGIKQSGYGRELGRYGIREFVNIKTVAQKG